MVIVSSHQLKNVSGPLFCETCSQLSDQFNVWWTDGKNDDGLDYCNIHVECATCHNEVFHKSAVGDIHNLDDAINVLSQ